VASVATSLTDVCGMFRAVYHSELWGDYQLNAHMSLFI